MEFDQLINSRFSVRSYTNQPVDRETILEVLKAAHIAPSAHNYQSWEFVVITSPENLEEIHAAYPRSWFKQAPVCIAVCTDHNRSWKRAEDNKDLADVDAAIAIDHLVLKATDLGLGTCWVCHFDVGLTRKVLNLPDHVEPIALIPLGYTTAQAPAKSRKPLADMVHWEKFTNS